MRRLADLFSAGTGLSENLPERRIPGDALPALDGTEDFLGSIGAEVPSDPTVRCKGNADPLSQDTAAALRADQGFHSATVGQQSNSLHRRKVKGTGGMRPLRVWQQEAATQVHGWQRSEPQGVLERLLQHA